MDTFHFVRYTPRGRLDGTVPVGPAVADTASRFHRGLPGYEPTPMVALPALASKLGLGALYVKDESKRFGLNAFKALGGSYAIGTYLCGRLGIPADENAFARLRSPEAREKLGELTFVTATDGNHGRGVAWSARLLGHRSVVYMPKGTAPERLENILAQGADASITDMVYDDAVRHAAAMAAAHGWILVQDTAWPGYEDIPARIMQGYTTMAQEAADALDRPPTHLFLQAGVGSMAGAVAGYFAERYGAERPLTVVVEPDSADCHYRTAKADDGALHAAAGPMDSMMAGLCCGEPCTLSWDILRACADGFIACGDKYSADGMRLLAKPCGADAPIISGESGAVTTGVAAAIMTEERLAPVKAALGMDGTSRVLCISTEGDTDRANYRKIVCGE